MQGCSEKNLDSMVHRRVRSDSRGRAIVSSAVPILHLESAEVHGAPDRGARKQKNEKDPSLVMNAEVPEREGEAVVAAVRLAPVQNPGTEEKVVGRRTTVEQ
jgi:hypothetical protein